MKILELPVNHNHLQARVDGFVDWLYQLDSDQMDSLLCDIEQYLYDFSANRENNDEDPTMITQAAIKVSESRWWLSQS
jgi:hypothetical protein